MKKKNIFIGVIITLLLISLVFGVIFAYKTYQSKHRVVSVQPVSNINWGYSGDTESSSGMVTNDSAQEIYLDDKVAIKEIYVTEGETVEVGDKLLSYDLSELNISIARKKIEINSTENEIAYSKNKLNYLKTSSPVDKTPPQIDENILKELEEQDNLINSVPEVDETTGYYNFVTSESIPSNVKINSENGELIYPEGTPEEIGRASCRERV